DDGHHPDVVPEHGAAPERPQHEVRQPERGDPERDGDDEDARGHAGDDVEEGQPPPGEQQPQHVTQGPHGATVALPADLLGQPSSSSIAAARNRITGHAPSELLPSTLTVVRDAGTWVVRKETPAS